MEGSKQAVTFLRTLRDTGTVTPAALQAFVAGVVRGEIPSYQAAAFLMLVTLRGLEDELTAALTQFMRDSGEVLQWPADAPFRVDKHSTGGVGDKLSLCILPMAVACGLAVPMLSGRGLGHTGGTVDKLQTIPGLNLYPTLPACVAQTLHIGGCFLGPNEHIAPADRILYALRDVTATVESIPLITASILSKKCATGLQGLVLDVKVGRAAFMPTLEQAKALANSLLQVSKQMGLSTTAILTRMEEPLGSAIGNALEVAEAIAMLQGQGNAALRQLCATFVGHMVLLAKPHLTEAQAVAMAEESIASGAASQAWLRILAAQGVAHGNSLQWLLDHLPRAKSTTTLNAPSTGYIQQIDGLALGLLGIGIGVGRVTVDATIAPGAGFVLHVQLGSLVQQGQPLLTVHHDSPLPEAWLQQLAQVFVVGSQVPAPVALLIATMSNHGMVGR